MVQSLRDMRVLVADDNMIARSIIAGVLQRKEISQIDTAHDGGKTRELIDVAMTLGRPYHLVFLDWDMPVLPGIEVLSFFRCQKKFDTTAFVMVTANSGQEHVLEAVKTGVTAYVAKPVSQAGIAKKVDEVLLWLRQRHKEFA